MHPTAPSDADCSPVLVELHIVPPVAMAVLTDDLDLHTQAAIDALLGAVRAVVVTHLTLDVHAVDFISLGTFGSLVEIAEVLERRGGRLTLSGARPIHRRVLSLLGADRIELTE